MKKIDGKKMFVVGGIILILIGIYFAATYAVPRALVTLTRAAPATKVSITESRVIGSKILAAADGIDKCIVNVFVMNNESRGVADRMVELVGAENISPKSTMTGKDGKATFEITSAVAGQFEVVAEVEGMPLSKGVKVTFR